MASAERGRTPRLPDILVFSAIIACCLIPHRPRFQHPSIYADDVPRIADLQTRPLASLWFRPFNEHMAPFFETVSWATWQVAGRRLSHAPIAFTLSSYLPFVLSLVLLGCLIRRETGSRTTAWASVALFGISPLYAEAVFWYSASSFSWALLWTLVVLLGAHAAEGPHQRAGHLGLFVGSLLAPACSGIGLLAGPLGTIRLAHRRSDRHRIGLGVLVPMLGLLLYLAICAVFRYDLVLSSGIRRKSDIYGGLILALRAPTAHLLPGIFGVHNVDLWLPTWLNLALSALGLIGLILWARRSRHRGLICGGLWLLLGGYALTFCFRTQYGPHRLLQIGRFQLFPQLGLGLMIAPAIHPRLSRCDHRPVQGLIATAGLVAFLLVVHLHHIEAQAQLYHFPEQHQTLAALERLGTICRTDRVTREQCIAALDPVWTHWFQKDFNGLTMLPASIPASERDLAQVRQVLLAQLTRSEREALWGGMDVTRYLRPVEELVGAHPECTATGTLVETEHAHHVGGRPVRGVRRYVLSGWPAYLEFDLMARESSRGVGTGAPRVLCVPCGPSPQPLELWWASSSLPWSASRCVRLRPDPSQPPREWALPLNVLPHWDAPGPSRIRIRFVAGPVTIGDPRLLR